MINLHQIHTHNLSDEMWAYINYIASVREVKKIRLIENVPNKVEVFETNGDKSFWYWDYVADNNKRKAWKLWAQQGNPHHIELLSND